MSAEQFITEHLDLWTEAATTKSTTGRGNNEKIELTGIKKLRELILELAVRGKLVPQNIDEEPAAELVSRAVNQKSELATNGKIRKSKDLPIVSESEKPFNLPIGWEYVRLGDIATPQAGFAFKSRYFNQTSKGLPLVRIRDVGQPFSGTYFSGEYRDEFVVHNDDYLISMDGQFRVARWLGSNALLNQRVSRLIFYLAEIEQQFELRSFLVSERLKEAALIC